MKKLLLVDGNSMLFRTYYATIGQSRRMTTSQGIPTNAVFGFIHLLQKAIAQIEPDAMLVAWDCGNRRSGTKDSRPTREPEKNWMKS